MRVTKLLFGALGFVVLGKKYVGRGWRCLWQHVVAAIAHCVLHTYTRGWGYDNRYTRSDNGFLIAFWSSVILYDDRSYMRLTNLPTPFKNWALRHLHKRTDLADPSPYPTHTAVLAIFLWPWFWSFFTLCVQKKAASHGVVGVTPPNPTLWKVLKYSCPSGCGPWPLDVTHYCKKTYFSVATTVNVEICPQLKTQSVPGETFTAVEAFRSVFFLKTNLSLSFCRSRWSYSHPDPLLIK